jgi:hypothetical protein
MSNATYLLAALFLAWSGNTFPAVDGVRGDFRREAPEIGTGPFVSSIKVGTQS